MPHRATPSILSAIAILLLAAGCQNPAAGPARTARSQLTDLGRETTTARATPPPLTADAAPADYVRYALLQHPAVFAAYSEWRGAVARIAPAGALPDPQLTFQADIAGTVMSLMPGVMFDLMLPGKRAAMAREAARESELAYRNYLATVVRTAAEVRRAWIELAFLDESLRLREAALGALGQSAALAANEYATGTGMPTLEAPLRLAGEAGRVRNDLTTLAERRHAAQVRFKAALGLAPAEPDPVWPRFPLTATPLASEEELWRRVLAANPDLGRMRAMVEMAVAGEEVAHRNRLPDFTAGLMVDVKQAPWMWRPTATLTLPIWREKIAGRIESARAGHDAASANVAAEELNMAAALARMVAMVRESDRMIDYIDRTALPTLERTRATSSAAYAAGMGRPAMIPETQLMALAMSTERLAALRDRELAVTDVLAMTATAAAGTALPLHERALAAQP